MRTLFRALAVAPRSCDVDILLIALTGQDLCRLLSAFPSAADGLWRWALCRFAVMPAARQDPGKLHTVPLVPLLWLLLRTALRGQPAVRLLQDNPWAVGLLCDAVRSAPDRARGPLC
jgi:hypothetical protein